MLNELPAESVAPAAAPAGITERVLRGSLWTIGGNGIALLASLLATPFTIRLLGPEQYGVLALINLLIGYLAVNDWGMGIGSTRFGAEAYARADEKGETAVIWTALLISAVPTLLAATALFAAAPLLLERYLNVPPSLQTVAAVALRLTVVGFLARVAANVLNTPQLVRLKMGLNAAITTIGGVLQICLTPLVILWGGGLVGAAAVISGVGVATALCHAFFSRRLLPGMFHPRLEPELLKPMVKFGSALVFTNFIGIILMNAEKLLLTHFNSVTDLAHYTVAFSLGNMLVLPASALVQSLLPTFANLQAGGQRTALQQLYRNMLRGIYILLPLVSFVICLGAKPFFIFWAGQEYGRASTPPFFILLVGLLANVATYVPYCLFTAFSRADFHARYHTLELLPYLVLATLLTARWGTLGAALAWSLRMVIGLPIYLWGVRRNFGLSSNCFEQRHLRFLGAVLILLLCLSLGLLLNPPWWGLALWGGLAGVAYLWVVYRGILETHERRYLLRGLKLRLDS